MYSFLKQVPLFAGLSEADLQRLCRVVEEVRLPAREVLFTEGSPGDQAYIIKEGQLEVLKASSGREVLLAVREPGEMIGEMALLEETPRMASVRARTDSVLLAIRKQQLNELLNTSHSAARAMFYTVLARWRATEAMLRHSGRMAQLGTLTAGIAHELNNPAAAVKRSADQLRAAMTRLAQSHSQLARLTLTEAQQQALQGLARRAEEQAMRLPELDALSRSDREQSLEEWLEGSGITDAWEVAPALADLNYDPAALTALARQFAPAQLPSALGWLAATYTVHGLLKEIAESAARMSEIVKALKSYSYLDQAPVQAVDVHEGLDNTLLIIRNKLKSGVTVHREYAADLPKIEAYGGELNQVWTNLLDNAADALEGRGGAITIRTRQDRGGVLVEIEDDGPGIPREIQPRVFDSFFTTKPPGKGTGLGLNISYNIVVHKHRGELAFASEPGRTCFRVWLPINFEAR